MLTGTLVTVAGFIPIGLNSSAAGEFTFTLFVVIAVSLVVSWLVAVLFAPPLGVAFLPVSLKHKHGTSSWFSRVFSRTLATCLRVRYLTIGVTLVLLGVSIYAFQFVEQQFFPDSDRPELVVQFKLDDASSIAATDAQMTKFEVDMLANNKAVEHWSTYVGNGAPRFLLTFEAPLPAASTGQIIVVTRGGSERDQLQRVFQEYIARQFPGSDITVSLLALGPMTGKPVQYRIQGPDVETLRQLSRDFAGRISENASLRDISYDWIEPVRVVRATLLVNQAQEFGVTPVDRRAVHG